MSKQKESEKRKRVNLGIGEKHELIKKIESAVSIVQVCDEHGVKKQAVSDIRRSKDKLTSYVMKSYVVSSKDRKGAVDKRKHMKVPNSRELEGAVYKWHVQQCTVSVCWSEIDDAAKKTRSSHGHSDGRLWRFRNRHGIGNKIERGESGSADVSAVEPCRPNFNRLMKKENLHLGQL